MQINHPFQIDGRGRVADVGEDAHIRQMIEQVLFTVPAGESPGLWLRYSTVSLCPQ
jgi:hypothetical protein